MITLQLFVEVEEASSPANVRTKFDRILPDFILKRLWKETTSSQYTEAGDPFPPTASAETGSFESAHSVYVTYTAGGPPPPVGGDTGKIAIGTYIGIG